MPEIIPAIIAKDFSELKKMVELVEPHVSIVQLDVMDGIFVPNKTWNTPQDLLKLKTKLELEAHLMIINPQRVLNKWLISKIRRVILHWEALEKISNLFKAQAVQCSLVSNLAEEAHRYSKEFGIALNPETSVDILDNFINKLDLVLLMSVEPGFYGRKFQEAIIPKIKKLRQRYPNVKIEIDGGVNLENAKKLIEAGANFLAVGSAVFGGSNVGEKIENFKNIISKN